MRYVEAAAYRRLLIETRAADMIGQPGVIIALHVLMEQLRQHGRQGLALSISNMRDISGASRTTLTQTTKKLVEFGWVAVSGPYLKDRQPPRHRARVPLLYGPRFSDLLADEWLIELRHLAEAGLFSTPSEGLPYAYQAVSQQLLVIDGGSQLLSPVMGRLMAEIGNEPIPGSTCPNLVMKKPDPCTNLDKTTDGCSNLDNTTCSVDEAPEVAYTDMLEHRGISDENHTPDDDPPDLYLTVTESVIRHLNDVEKTRFQNRICP